MERSRELPDMMGATTLECAREIVRTLGISVVTLRRYNYIPNQPSDREELFNLPNANFSDQHFMDILQGRLGEDDNLALSCHVILANGRPACLPMMDMDLPAKDGAEAYLAERIREKIKPEFGGGYLLKTNKSYHFLGEKPFPAQDFHRFLAYFLTSGQVIVTPDGVANMHIPFADNRYIGWSMRRNDTGLRLTSRGTKKVSPIVVARV